MKRWLEWSTLIRYSTCRALKMTTGVRGERVALLSRSSSSFIWRPLKSVGGLSVWVPQYWTELKASGYRESFLKRSNSIRSTDSKDLSAERQRGDGSLSLLSCYSVLALSTVYISQHWDCSNVSSCCHLSLRKKAEQIICRQKHWFSTVPTPSKWKTRFYWIKEKKKSDI